MLFKLPLLNICTNHQINQLENKSIFPVLQLLLFPKGQKQLPLHVSQLIDSLLLLINQTLVFLDLPVHPPYLPQHLLFSRQRLLHQQSQLGISCLFGVEAALVLCFYFLVLLGQIEDKLGKFFSLLPQFSNLLIVLFSDHFDVQHVQLFLLLVAHLHVVFSFCRKSVDLVVLSVQLLLQLQSLAFQPGNGEIIRIAIMNSLPMC